MNSRPSIKDKALLAASTPSAPPQAPATVARTGPGALVRHLQSESIISAENQDLKEQLAQWDGAKPHRPLDPKTIRASRWANRHKDSFQDPEFDSLRDEIQHAGGNVQPILVRPLVSPDGPFLYEVVFGHRRHRACLALDLPVLSMIRQMSDQDLFSTMDRENRERKDLRPYEQGVMYKRAIEEGLFSSTRKMAAELGISSSIVSTAIQLANLPDSILEAFSSPLDIQYRWAAPLLERLEKAPAELDARIKSLGRPHKLSGPQVFEHLMGSQAPAPRSISVKGQPEVKIVQSSRGAQFVFKKIDAGLLGEVEAAILAVLERRAKS